MTREMAGKTPDTRVLGVIRGYALAAFPVQRIRFSV